MNITYGTLNYIIRSVLDENTNTIITDTDILNSINNSYKDVSSRAFCIESLDSATTIPNCQLIKFNGYSVNDVELVALSSNVSLLKINPQLLGHAPINGNDPQYWFQWNEYIVIEPIPDDSYTLNLYISDYPSDQMYSALMVIYRNTADIIFEDTTDIGWFDVESSSDELSELPDEFLHCIIYFCLYTLSMKLKKWSKVGVYYNNYIKSLKTAKDIYISKRKDMRWVQQLPTIEV